MELTPERIERLQALFEQALELCPAERGAFLDSVSDADADLREEVLALIAAHESGATLPEVGIDPAAEFAPEVPASGQRVGPWRIEDLLGQGGMGTVCSAVRADEQFEKRVAIKFLHAQAGNAAAEQRFRAERQILASLDHPNVATLLDGGVTEDGQPYLVMEYVDGEPITDWADARGLSRRARVELMLQVCAAVEAAHRSLIVHRDLKPGNILVTSQGRVKLLDFGIARLLGEVAPASAGTRGTDQRSFTPSYAAPEQLRNTLVTTATDVFALGVMLYRLLTGRLPFENRTNPDQSALPAGLEPDLDALIARAMNVDASQRYSTVQELRAELERWLRHQPVLARGGGMAYRLGLFVRRHRAGTALGAAALLAILVASGVAAWQYQKARQAAADQQEMNAFLLEVFEMSDPFAEGEDITLGEALDRAAASIATRFAGRPDLSAQIRFGIGYSMMSRYRLEQAGEQLDLALQESTARFGPADVRTLRAAEALAWLRVEQGRMDEAEAAYLRVIAALEDAGLQRDPLYSTTLCNLGNVYLQMERYAEADAQLQRSAAAAERQDTPLSAGEQAGMLSNLAHAAHGLEDYDRAERYYSEAADAFRLAFPQGSPDMAILFNNHAMLREDRGDMPQALAMHRESLDMRRKVFRNEHPMVVVALANVARMSLEVGDPAAALQAAEEGAAMADRVYSEPHRYYVSMHATLAAARLAQADQPGAVAAVRRTRALLEDFPAAPPSVTRWVQQVEERVCAAVPASCSLQ